MRTHRPEPARFGSPAWAGGRAWTGGRAWIGARAWAIALAWVGARVWTLGQALAGARGHTGGGRARLLARVAGICVAAVLITVGAGLSVPPQPTGHSGRIVDTAPGPGVPGAGTPSDPEPSAIEPSDIGPSGIEPSDALPSRAEPASGAPAASPLPPREGQPAPTRPPTQRPPAPAPPPVPAPNIGQTRQFTVTYYGGRDNTPPGTSVIAFPTVHREAGGTGTFRDPITLATSRAVLAVGTVVYYPFLKRYFVMEDDCTPCTGELSDRGVAHVILWLGPSTNVGLLDCEAALTQNGQVPVIVNPVSNLAVDTTPLYDGSHCYQPH